jgi:hypothetical protein
MNRSIRILPDFIGHTIDAICFETKCSPQEVMDLSLYAFEHHGPAYTPLHPGALRLFHERVLLGQNMPPTLFLTEWYKPDQLMAAAIFSNPSTVLLSRCTDLVNSVDMVDRLGSAAYGHIDVSHKELLFLLNHLTKPYISSDISSTKKYTALELAIKTILQFLENPHSIPVDLEEPKYEILYVNAPLVIFRSMDYAWDHLYSEGFLYGFCVSGDQIVFSKKSPLVQMDVVYIRDLLMASVPAGQWTVVEERIVGTYFDGMLEDIIKAFPDV